MTGISKRSRARASADLALPPGPGTPVPWQTLAWMGRPGPFLERCQRRFGDIFTISLAYEGKWVILAHPDAVQQVFTGDPSRLHAGEANAVLRPILGSQSVLLLDDQPHLLKRKLMLPAFHGECIQRHGLLMQEIAEREIERWPIGQPFPLLPRMQAITLEVIMRAVLGVEEGSRLERLGAVLRDLLDWSTNPRALMALLMVGPDLTLRLTPLRVLRRRVDAAIYGEISHHRDDPRVEERDDVLSLLLQARYEDGVGISDEDLRDQLVTLLIAGHETTATALAWAFERLLHTPAAFERVREKLADGDEAYLDAVCRETLRLRPVLPLVGRRLLEPMQIGGWTLPAGTKVAPCIHLIHRRPDIYPEPERFRPERFLEEPAGTYTWIPFGGGIRRCLGSSFALFEMKAVLSAIVARTSLRAARAERERMRRRAITWGPARGAEAVLDAIDSRLV
jgi:cytochrome P450 family 135